MGSSGTAADYEAAANAAGRVPAPPDTWSPHVRMGA
jgi:hypothetical protein